MSKCCPLCGGSLDSDVVTILADRGVIVANGRQVPLTGQEMRLFLTLFEARPRVISREGLLSTLYALEQDEAEIKIIDVFICKMRKKLKFLGLSIETAWGRGYWLKFEGKATVVEAAEVEAA